ncbi:MAG: flagellar basal body P-ring formation chaperone FlgA [Bacteroidota bacterium]
MYLLASMLFLGFLLPEHTSPVRTSVEESILEQTQALIEERYDTEGYRFSASIRWMPSRLSALNPASIRSVSIQGNVQRYTNLNVVVVEHGLEVTEQVRVKVEASRFLPVLKHRMLRGEEISQDDITMSWVSVNLDKDNAVSRVEDIDGHTLRKNLNAGAYILKHQLTPMLWVRETEDVQFLFEDNGLRIALTCEARQNGVQGEIIATYCKETRKKYMAEVIRPGVVQWRKNN